MVFLIFLVLDGFLCVCIGDVFDLSNTRNCRFDMQKNHTETFSVPVFSFQTIENLFRFICGNEQFD